MYDHSDPGWGGGTDIKNRGNRYMKFNDSMSSLVTITSLRLVDYLIITLAVISTKSFRLVTEIFKNFPTGDSFADVK